MTGYANAYEMRMPAHYVDMNQEEMEYGGTGLDWFDGVWEACVSGATGGATIGAAYGWVTGAGWGVAVAGASMVNKLIENITGETLDQHIDNICSGFCDWVDSWSFW